MVRGPAPRLVRNPSPAVWLAPFPVAVAIRGPVVIVVDDGDAWTPDVSVVARVDPVAVEVEFFSAVDFRVVVAFAPFVFKVRGDVALALIVPVVPLVYLRG